LIPNELAFKTKLKLSSRKPQFNLKKPKSQPKLAHYALVKALVKEVAREQNAKGEDHQQAQI